MVGATLFWPWLDWHVFVTRGPVEEGIFLGVRGSWEYAEMLRIVRFARFVRSQSEPEQDLYTYVYAHDVNAYMWHYDCASFLEPHAHYVESLPVRPPWVPIWVVRWTLLAYVVPDYVRQCW
jgi:hypothetical protein